jgi:hypothetical protein
MIRVIVVVEVVARHRRRLNINQLYVSSITAARRLRLF